MTSEISIARVFKSEASAGYITPIAQSGWLFQKYLNIRYLYLVEQPGFLSGRRRNRMLIDIDLLDFTLPLHSQRGAHRGDNDRAERQSLGELQRFTEEDHTGEGS